MMCKVSILYAEHLQLKWLRNISRWWMDREGYFRLSLRAGVETRKCTGNKLAEWQVLGLQWQRKTHSKHEQLRRKWRKKAIVTINVSSNHWQKTMLAKPSYWSTTPLETRLFHYAPWYNGKRFQGFQISSITRIHEVIRILATQMWSTNDALLHACKPT